MTALDPDVARQVRAQLVGRFGLMPETFTDMELTQRLRAEFGSDAAIVEALRHADAEPLSGSSVQRLVSALTIRESSFLRQRSWFEKLAHEFLLPVIERKRHAGIRRLCLWSAGCASGEEPYTLALLIDELIPDRADWTIEIHGTDICADALDQARAGRYRLWSLRELGPDRQAAHFALHAGGATVSERLRTLVRFRLLNLLGDMEAAPREPDVVLCRNVLMHLTPPARAIAAARLAERLAPGGILATAPSEASSDLFRPLVRHDRGELLVFCHPPERPAAAEPVPPPVERRKAVRAAKARPMVTPWSPERPPPVATDARPTGSWSPESWPPESWPQAEARIDRLAAEGRLAEAVGACERARAAAPLDPAPLRLLAAIQESADDLDGACRTLRRLLYLDDADLDARFRLAVLLRRRRRDELAVRELRALLTIASRPSESGGVDPGRARILLAVRQLLEAGRTGAGAAAAGDRR